MTIGVFGYNTVSAETSTVEPADIFIAGMQGRFSRGLDRVLDVDNMRSLDTVIGPLREGYYGREVAETFFQNLGGRKGLLKIRPFVASDAVQAATLVRDEGDTADVLRLSASYKETVDRSADGNLTGFTLVNGSRFTSAAAVDMGVSDSSIFLRSVADIRKGDILRTDTGTLIGKVSTVTEATREVLFESPTTQALTVGETVNAVGFQVSLYRRNSRGAETPIRSRFDKLWLSMEPENVELYAGTAFKQHPWLSLDVLNGAGTVDARWPDEVTGVQMLQGGADGTPPLGASDWTDGLRAFDTEPVRFLFNSDSSLSGTNTAGEEYCINRLDSPIWLYNIPAHKTVDELVEYGHDITRSNQVQGVACAGWRHVLQKGTHGDVHRLIPTVGAQCGAWFRSIYSIGFHRSPADSVITLKGFQTIGDGLQSEMDKWSNDDRERIFESGINIIQSVPGSGLRLRNWRTPSSLVQHRFGKYLLGQNLVKLSSVESLQGEENRLSRISNLRRYGELIRDFAVKLHRGSFPFGVNREGAFAVYDKEDGTTSELDDVFFIIVDETNNPQSELNKGNGTLAVEFYMDADLVRLGIPVSVGVPL